MNESPQPAKSYWSHSGARFDGFSLRNAVTKIMFIRHYQNKDRLKYNLAFFCQLNISQIFSVI